MKFRVSHTTPHISVTDFEALFFDEAFNAALCEHLHLRRTIVTRSLSAGVLTRVVQITPERELPATAQKLLGQLGIDRIAYTEHLRYPVGSLQGTFRLEPAAMADKLQSQGTLSFAAAGDGVSRVVEGEVNVKIFGIGGMVERLVVADVERSYEEAAGFTLRWIAEHGTPSAAAVFV